LVGVRGGEVVELEGGAQRLQSGGEVIGWTDTKEHEWIKKEIGEYDDEK
jgi:hypothetical protein